MLRKLAVVLLLAGCAAPTPEATPEAPAGFTLSGTDCREVVVAVPADLAAVQALLPEGYVASDAGVVLGIPVASGQALFLAANMDCAEGNLTVGGATSRALFHLGEFVIVVEPPEGAPEGGSLYAYEFKLVHSDDAVGDAFAGIGWNVTSGVVARQSERAPVGGPVVFDQVWTTDEETYRGRGTYDPASAAPAGTKTYIYHGPLAEARVVTFEGEFALARPSSGTFEASAGSMLATLAGERGAAGVLYVAAPAVSVRPLSP